VLNNKQEQNSSKRFLKFTVRNSQSDNSSRKPCCRKETVRCRKCSFQFKVRHRHSL